MKCVVSSGIPLSSSDDNYFSNVNQTLADIVGKAIEQCLKLWITSIGEIRNHQSLACHTDANHSHDIKTSGLLRHAGSPKKDCLLCFPLDNACVRVVHDR